jgi:hypothetical protein
MLTLLKQAMEHFYNCVALQKPQFLALSFI